MFTRINTFTAIISNASNIPDFRCQSVILLQLEANEKSTQLGQKLKKD